MELTEQRLKKILQEQRLEYQRHLDVVVEDFDSNIRVLGEAVSGVQQLAEEVLLLERRRA